MGQHQKATMTVATEERGGGTLRRLILVFAVAVLIAAMVALSAMPAFAEANIRNNGKGSDAQGQTTANQNCGDAFDRQGAQGLFVGHKQTSNAPANCDHFFDPKK